MAKYGLSDPMMDMWTDPEYAAESWTFDDGIPMFDSEVLRTTSYAAAAAAVGKPVCQIGVISDLYRGTTLNQFLNQIEADEVDPMVMAELRVATHKFTKIGVQTKLTDIIVNTGDRHAMIFVLKNLYRRLDPTELSALETEVNAYIKSRRQWREIRRDLENRRLKQVELDARIAEQQANES